MKIKKKDISKQVNKALDQPLGAFKLTKLPVYFEAFGSFSITVSFVIKNNKYHGTATMLLAECPDAMRAAVNNNPNHFKTKNSAYILDKGKYKITDPIPV